MIDGKDVEIEIKKIKGKEARYDVWSVVGIARLLEVEEFEREIEVSVNKDSNVLFDDDEEISSYVLSKIEKRYKKYLDREVDFKEFGKTTDASEDAAIKKVEGKKYSRDQDVEDSSLEERFKGEDHPRYHKNDGELKIPER